MTNDITHGKPDGAVRAKSIDADTPYPSPEAMKAAVELEIHRALGSVQTVVIGKLIQQAIDAALSPKIAAAETSPGDAALADELEAAANWMQLYLDTFGEIGDDATQASIDDWHDIVKRARLAAPQPQSGEAWRYEIQHGPDGETDYAWVYDEKNNFVCSAKTHHAIAIVARSAAIDRRDVKAEAKSQEPDAWQWRFKQQGQWSRWIDLLPDHVDSFRQIQSHNLKSGNCETRPLYIHPTTKPEAPAVSVDAIKAALRPFIGHDTLGVKAQDAARVVAALIAGGR